MRFYSLLLFMGFGLPFTLHASPITGTTAVAQTTSAVERQRSNDDKEVLKHLDILENMSMYEQMDMYEHLNVFEQEDKK